MSDTRPILVGEANPYGSAPEYALYPYPENSAGGRLCRLIMAIEPHAYIRRFDRRNLCPQKWSVPVARASAAAISGEMERWGYAEPRGRSRAAAVLLGSKVCSAFGIEFRPFTVMAMVGRWRAAILPHPSGLCRLWHEPGAVANARRAIREAGIDLPIGITENLTEISP